MRVGSYAPVDPAVLCRLYLCAVLPCLSDLAEQDLEAREFAGELQASIVMCVLGGPAATIHLQRGRIRWSGRIDWRNDAGRVPSVILLFLNARHLNAFFSGNQWAVPLPVWGGWRFHLLARFSKLAERLEAVLDGVSNVIDTKAGRRLHARLSLIAAGLGLEPLAEGDEAARRMLRSLPQGLASFNIEGEQRATVWFEHGAAGCPAGWGEPPRRPDVRITFGDVDTAYGALREEIDTLAAVGGGQIRVEGLVPLADGLNLVMQRLRPYLKP
jgi:hypothetical protein